MKSELKSIVFVADATAANQGTQVQGDMVRNVYRLNASRFGSGMVQTLTLMERFSTSDRPKFASHIGHISGDADVLPLLANNELPLMTFRGSSYIRSEVSGDVDVGILVTLAYKDEYE